ncbi:MAG: AAC(3) family N-acetyltransferase, partial [Treponema sp.]|nr:AAC(3) family N-acetyltransferase [Treponema sp.]
MLLTKMEIENDLRKLGVKSGMMLEVHCSLSSFGYVDGGANTIIEVLKHIVGINGSIVMPTYKHAHNSPLNEIDKRLGLTIKIKYLKDDEESSAMGIVADTFRKMPDVITGEGIFRVSAWGKDAEKHVSSGFQHII